jgi:hypothetical protein
VDIAICCNEDEVDEVIVVQHSDRCLLIIKNIQVTPFGILSVDGNFSIPPTALEIDRAAAHQEKETHQK